MTATESAKKSDKNKVWFYQKGWKTSFLIGWCLISRYMDRNGSRSICIFGTVVTTTMKSEGNAFRGWKVPRGVRPPQKGLLLVLGVPALLFQKHFSFNRCNSEKGPMFLSFAQWRKQGGDAGKLGLLWWNRGYPREAFLLFKVFVIRWIRSYPRCTLNFFSCYIIRHSATISNITAGVRIHRYELHAQVKNACIAVRRHAQIC